MNEELKEIIEKITLPNEKDLELAKKKWDSVAKPLGGLGAFEDIVSQICAIRGRTDIEIKKPVLLICCGDNGVVKERVSQCGQDVTKKVMLALSSNESTVSYMAEQASCPVLTIDAGVNLLSDIEGEREEAARLSDDEIFRLSGIREEKNLKALLSSYNETGKIEGILNRRIKNGTEDILNAPAMKRDECLKAVMNGIELVGELKEEGFDLIFTGEMGIGNTTTSACIASCILSMEPGFFVGRGAGLSDEMLEIKREVIIKAVGLRKPLMKDTIDTLAKVGGLEIATICGIYLGGAFHKIPVVMDGIITSAAALCAKEICPLSMAYLIPSHGSAESGADILLNSLGKKAPIKAGMHLGEGSGAIMLLPLLRMVFAVFNCGHDFGKLGIDEYKRFEDKALL